MAKQTGRLSAAEIKALLQKEKVKQSLDLLGKVGVPIDGMKGVRKLQVALSLLAAANLRPATPWADAAVMTAGSAWAPTQKAFLAFWNEHYGTRYSPGSYDMVLQDNLPFLLNSLLAVSNRPAGSRDPTGGYGVAPEAADVVRKYGSPNWQGAVDAFSTKYGRLSEKMERPREIPSVPAQFVQGFDPQYSEGEHGQLLKAIVEVFLEKHARASPTSPGAIVLLFEDNHYKYRDEERMREVGLAALGDGQLPDVIAYDPVRKIVFIIESVYSANPVTKIRHVDLERITQGCTVPRVYVTVFRGRAEMKKYLDDMSWETEVWFADDPGHVLHFDGDKYMVPHTAPREGQSDGG